MKIKIDVTIDLDDELHKIYMATTEDKRSYLIKRLELLVINAKKVYLEE